MGTDGGADLNVARGGTVDAVLLAKVRGEVFDDLRAQRIDERDLPGRVEGVVLEFLTKALFTSMAPARLADGGHCAVVDGNDRLDAQQIAYFGEAGRDASAAAQVLELVENAADADVVAQVLQVRRRTASSTMMRCEAIAWRVSITVM